jgi:isocitrate dehydrogenase
VLLEHEVEAGDIWRACQTKDVAIRDWVKLAVTRARATGAPAVFWLDRERAHDAELIRKVEAYLEEHDTAGLEIRSCRRWRPCVLPGADPAGRGHHLGHRERAAGLPHRPLPDPGDRHQRPDALHRPPPERGGLFETGAGGSAPKHVQQFEKEGHLRWDSLGEYMALAASLQHLGETFDNPGARVLGDTLDTATARYLENSRSPAYKVHELDNRGSTFYLTLYWAEELAEQTADPALAERFAPVAGRWPGTRSGSCRS